MLIWINGPFGVGKTQAAYELHRRLPASFVSDPEQLGIAIHRMTPPTLRGDFQDVPAWREGVYQVLDRNARDFRGVTIVPMTVVSPATFEDLVGRLRAGGHHVVHVALLASHDTLLRRLRTRGERSDGWAARQVDRCLTGLRHLDPADHLDTDGRTHEDVVEAVARRAGIVLQPDRSGMLQRRLRRLHVQRRHG